QIDEQKRIIIAMDAACGMEYLHENNLTHFNLKSHNLLVNMRDHLMPVCKIGDLGLSRVKQQILVCDGVQGALPWIAPKLLNRKQKVNEKVDVYSFGIVMWELLTGKEPYSAIRPETIIGKLRPEIPCWCNPQWRALMEKCWTSVPDARPSFSEIVTEIRAMAASMNIK
ncbi:serine/threonine-protein kinase EDR1, partial [Tanacetum coccineum]